MNKNLRFLLLCIIFGIVLVKLAKEPPAQASPANVDLTAAGPAQVDPAVQASLDSLQPGEMTTVIVTLRRQANLALVSGLDRAARQQGVIRALQATAAASQGPLENLLNARQNEGLVSSFDSFWVFNGFSVTGTGAVIDELARHPDVRLISPDDIDIVPAASAPAEANIAATNAPDLWGLGYSGQGVVVASLDTGVDANHPDLASRWRGGSNSWFDPYGQQPDPVDLNGHGTETVGVLVGGDAGGTSIGMAPQAQWIAARIYNDRGRATANGIHQAFQWLLDPDGDPGTADAPQIVNNSWAYGSPGCNLSFQPDLQALVAAGITPVFAAGNYGPGSNTSVSPANNPEAFAVGATDNSGQIWAQSSRGPSACGESSTVYPELTAPGVNVKTTDRFGLYTQDSGTSLSAPAVSGSLALLLSAYPDLTVAQQEMALTTTAVDLGPAGPDNTFGFGRLDALAAYQWLVNGGAGTQPTATPTAIAPSPTPTATPTTAPTATPTPTPTATPSNAGTVHIGDLDDVSTASGHKKWDARVDVLVHDASDLPLAGATVYGTWSDGVSGDASCLTGASGHCTLSATGVMFKTPALTFTVSDVVQGSLTYSAALNHDPDGDSNGTAILLSMP